MVPRKGRGHVSFHCEMAILVSYRLLGGQGNFSAYLEFGRCRHCSQCYLDFGEAADLLPVIALNVPPLMQGHPPNRHALGSDLRAPQQPDLAVHFAEPLLFLCTK